MATKRPSVLIVDDHSFILMSQQPSFFFRPTFPPIIDKYIQANDADSFRALIKSDPSLVTSENAHKIAQLNKPEFLNVMIEAGIDINCPSTLKFTLLITALSASAADTSLFLIRKGADIHTPFANQRTPLFWAASSGIMSVLMELLNRNVDVNVRDQNGFTPLHSAATEGKFKAVKALVEHGAEIDPMTNIKVTPLMQAVINGDHEIMNYLIDRGASFLAPMAFGWTAITQSLRYKRHSNIRMLLFKGADPNAIDDNGYGCIDFCRDLNVISTLYMNGMK